jgi:ribosomal protein L11 methyltransferase
LDIEVAPGERTALAAWLVARTGAAVEEKDDGSFVSFAPDVASADALTRSLREDFPHASVKRRALPPIDWSTRWRDGIAPRHFGRLTVVPSWLSYSPRDNEVLVVIDPETAFGTGEHGSTRAALTLLERHLATGDRMVDLGSGSGILAIAAMKLGARSATGLELDPEALPVSRTNAERNGVAARFLEGEAGSLAPLLGPADLLCSNILRTVNQGLLPAIRLTLRAGGIAIFAGMELPERPLFEPVMREAGFEQLDEAIDGDWWAVAARR